MSNSLIVHPAFDDTGNRLLRELDGASPGSLIFLLGMPGSGKSRLIRSVMNKIAGNPALWGRGRLPQMMVAAAPTDRSYFSPKDFQARLLQEVRMPRLDWLEATNPGVALTIQSLKSEIAESSVFWRDYGRKSSENATRRAFEDCARERQLKKLFVDQVGSIAFTQRGREASDHMYSLMCMAEEIPLAMILSGTVRARALWDGNIDVRRRSTFVVFPRYNIRDRAGVMSLGRLWVTLTKDYAFESDAAPSKMIKLIYAATLGIFDEIKKLVLRADRMRLDQGACAITKKHLEGAVLPARELNFLHEEAAQFDSLLAAAEIAKLVGKL
jgi:hypothetical protein